MIEIIKEKLQTYLPQTAVEEENALKEILQEVALYGLWRADFFKLALFQGGTSLRILHGLPRFSEDLDFLLRAPDSEFNWAPFLVVLTDVFDQFGLKLEALPKEKMDGAIRQAILKDTAIANQLDLTFAGAGRQRVLKIKLEIDTNPPALSGEATTYLDFPSDYECRHQDLPSNFALKIHALLCRPFLKGRDWYDFSWYVMKGISPNLPHLREALIQKGPWQGQTELVVDPAWVQNQLAAKIGTIAWLDAVADVERFLRPTELKATELWSEGFFLAKLRKLGAS
jgi:hypothetical protein